MASDSFIWLPLLCLWPPMPYWTERFGTHSCSGIFHEYKTHSCLHAPLPPSSPSASKQDFWKVTYLQSPLPPNEPRLARVPTVPLTLLFLGAVTTCAFRPNGYPFAPTLFAFPTALDRMQTLSSLASRTPCSLGLLSASFT